MSALPSLSKSYTPQEGSTAWKVIQFLTTNPEEALSSSDIEAKFDKPAKQVHSILWAATGAGVLRREEDHDGELVYRLGNGTPLVKARPAAHPTLSIIERAPVRAQRRGASQPKIDIAAVRLEDDVPLISRGSPANDWLSLVHRMQKGQSCLLPLAVEHSLRNFRTKLHKDTQARIRVSRVSEEHVRLWRLE